MSFEFLDPALLLAAFAGGLFGAAIGGLPASPVSATNLEWFFQRLSPLEVEGKERGTSRFDFVNEEVEVVLEKKSRVFYHPFL